MDDTDWKASDFVRRAYYVQDEGAPADKPPPKIEVIVKVDGAVFAQTVLTHPGLLAVVSKPTEDGFWIDRVEHAAGGPALVEADGVLSGTPAIAAWQQLALEIA